MTMQTHASIDSAHHASHTRRNMEATAAHFSVIQLHFCTTPCLRAAKNIPPPADEAGNTHTHTRQTTPLPFTSVTHVGGRAEGLAKTHCTFAHIATSPPCQTNVTAHHRQPPPTTSQPATRLSSGSSKQSLRVACASYMSGKQHTLAHTYTHTGGIYVLHTICARLGHRSG